jgi:hypothetical protein
MDQDNNLGEFYQETRNGREEQMDARCPMSGMTVRRMMPDEELWNVAI